LTDRRRGGSTSTTWLLRAVALLAEREEVRLRYQARFRYLLVDEYQDTNRPSTSWCAGWWGRRPT
jgi:DNA helicase-2/ATP-dependent DNA helicase PcrA